MANNALLYNAALSGFVAGSLGGALQIDPDQADYAAIVAQGVTFATALDAAIANDLAASPQPAGTPAISIAGGAAILAPAATSGVEAQHFKVQLMKDLCFGFAFQRYATGNSASVFTTAIAAIKAIYFQAALSGVYT